MSFKINSCLQLSILVTCGIMFLVLLDTISFKFNNSFIVFKLFMIRDYKILIKFPNYPIYIYTFV